VYGFQTFLNSCIIDILAHDSSRFEVQHGDQDNESKHVLVLTGDVSGAEDFHHADDQSAQHGAGDIADAAQHGGGKGLDAGQKTHVVAHRAVVEPHHDAGGGGQPRADGKGQGDDPVAADGDQRCS
jgi:hypothetical protein